MTENFIDARKSRRRIIEVLKKQQLEDSCCAEKLSQVGLRGKRTILELLAEWMVSFESDKRSRDVDRETFAAITQVGLEDWLSMQRREATQNQQKIKASRVEEELYKVYDRVAPNGVLSIMFTKGAEASLYLADCHGRKAVIKVRIPKKYRPEALDKRIRSYRTVHEPQLMHEAKAAGVPTPLASCTALAARPASPPDTTRRPSALVPPLPRPRDRDGSCRSATRTWCRPGTSRSARAGTAAVPAGPTHQGRLRNFPCRHHRWSMAAR